MKKTHHVEATTLASIENKEEVESRVLYKTISAKFFIPSQTSKASNLFCLRNFYYNADSYALPPKNWEESRCHKRVNGKYSLGKINQIVAFLFFKEFKKPLPFSGLDADGHWCSSVLKSLDIGVWNKIYGIDDVPEDENTKKTKYFFQTPQFSAIKSFRGTDFKNLSQAGIKRTFLGKYETKREEYLSHPPSENLIKGLASGLIGLPITPKLEKNLQQRSELKSMLMKIEKKIDRNVEERKELKSKMKELQENLPELLSNIDETIAAKSKTILRQVARVLSKCDENVLEKVIAQFQEYLYIHPEDDEFEPNSELNEIVRNIAEEAITNFNLADFYAPDQAISESSDDDDQPPEHPGDQARPVIKPFVPQQQAPPKPGPNQPAPNNQPNLQPPLEETIPENKPPQTNIPGTPLPTKQQTRFPTLSPFGQKQQKIADSPHLAESILFTVTSPRKDSHKISKGSFSGAFPSEMTPDVKLEVIESVSINESDNTKLKKAFEKMNIIKNILVGPFGCLAKVTVSKNYFYDEASKINVYKTDIDDIKILMKTFHAEKNKCSAFISMNQNNMQTLLKCEKIHYKKPSKQIPVPLATFNSLYKQKKLNQAATYIVGKVLRGDQDLNDHVWRTIPKLFSMYAFLSLLRTDSAVIDKELAGAYFFDWNKHADEAMNTYMNSDAKSEVKDFVGYDFDLE